MLAITVIVVMIVIIGIRAIVAIIVTMIRAFLGLAGFPWRVPGLAGCHACSSGYTS